MKVKKSLLHQSPFFGNFFCLIPNSNLAFVAISKNAVTFLKKTAYYNANDIWVEGFHEIHDLIGYSENSPFLIPVEKMKDYEKRNKKLIKVAVWRDPIERVVSTYSLFCLKKEYRSYFHYLGLHNDISFKDFMLFLDYEWNKKQPIYQDEHIRRQVDYYSKGDVDYIINISNLNAFLENMKIKFKYEKSNKTSFNFKIENKFFIEKIMNYYKEDYNIKCNY